jgi:hypothetical protein
MMAKAFAEERETARPRREPFVQSMNTKELVWRVVVLIRRRE